MRAECGKHFGCGFGMPYGLWCKRHIFLTRYHENIVTAKILTSKESLWKSVDKQVLLTFYFLSIMKTYDYEKTESGTGFYYEIPVKENLRAFSGRNKEAISSRIRFNGPFSRQKT